MGGREAHARYRIRTKSGELRWLRDAARPIVSGEEQIVQAVIGSFRRLESREGEHSDGDVAQRMAALIAQSLHNLVCLIDDHGNLLWASAEPATPFARSVRALTRTDLSAVVPPRPLDTWLDLVDSMFASRERVSGRIVWHAQDEQWPVVVDLVPLDASLALAVFKVGEERAEPLAEPAQSEAAAARPAILDALPFPALLLDDSLQALDANAPARRLLGIAGPRLREPDAFLGVLAPASRQEMREAASAAIASGTPRLFSARREGEDEPFAELQMTALTGAGSRRLLVSSPLHAAPSVTRAQDEGSSLELLMSVAADGIVCLDHDLSVTWLNDAARKILGLQDARGAGQTLEGMLLTIPFAGGDADADFARQLKEAPWQRDFQVRRRDGELVPVEVAARFVDVGERRLYVVTLRDVTVRQQTEAALRHLAYHDPLTGLPNRLLFLDRVNQAIERSRRDRRMLAVMLVDLDRFKVINDSLGLDKGDQVLRAVGERMVKSLRKSDTVARLGADEFMLLLPGVETAEAAAKVAQKVIDALKPPMVINGHELTVGAGIGIALFPYDGDEPETLIKNADASLTRAKEQGRNHCQFYTTDMNAAAFERLMLESRLRRALAHGELVVYYQPIASLESGEIVGVEALLRWFHPEVGLVPPSDFIPLAEETGLIVPIGSWVLATACTQAQRWQQQLALPNLRVSVNISARQFQQRDLVNTLATALQRSGLRAECLELELTEGVIMRDVGDSGQRLHDITALGVNLAIDDFGTGYSSLAYLRSFPIHSLKIDRSFIQDIHHDANSATIAQAVVVLGTSLGLRVVAEGVERRDQLSILRGFGCHDMQGYLLARPLPAEEALAIIRRSKPLEALF